MYPQTEVESSHRIWIWGLTAEDFDAKMGDFQTILRNTKSVYKIENLCLDQKGCFDLFSSAEILLFEILSMSMCSCLHRKARQDSLKWNEIQGRAEAFVQAFLYCILCLYMSQSPPPLRGSGLALLCPLVIWASAVSLATHQKGFELLHLISPSKRW